MGGGGGGGDLKGRVGRGYDGGGCETVGEI